MHNHTERRKANRYPLSVPAHFTWAPQDGDSQSGQGVTRDINTLAVYIFTDALPPAGARVRMEIALPKLKDTGSGMKLFGEGVVLRSEHGDATMSGFAASAQFYPKTADVVLSQLNGAGQA